MIRWLFCACAAVSTVLASRIALQYYQLESYQFGGYFRTLRRNWMRAVWPGFLVSLLACALSGILTANAFDDWRLVVSATGTMVLAAGVYWLQRRMPAKKPLVFTTRVKRLLVIECVTCALLAVLLVFGLKILSAALLLPVLALLCLALAALVALPLEKLINRLYLRDAMKRLDRMPELIKIGITGSFGKTSTKFMLETILSEKYRVLVTPASFNTSMGVTRVIRERLAPDHQVFVAEMGARHRGDIRLLCKLVRPKYGILTSIGPQHLETFHSQENITREKSELARSIPQDGAMVFAADGAINESVYQQTKCPKHLAGSRAEGFGLFAKDIEFGPWGSRFVLTDGKEEFPCETRLLGEHNISNLLCACTMARVLSMSLPEIARGAAKVQPVEHRLQILRGTGGVTVIDDAFNANPVGAKAALDVLKRFPGRRIIVTPGFVELGAKEEEYNRELGRQIAQSVDIAVLVGRRHTAPIAEGIKNSGFAQENLTIVGSLTEATNHLAGVFRAGDVVLYENDLPDNYQE